MPSSLPLTETTMFLNIARILTHLQCDAENYKLEMFTVAVSGLLISNLYCVSFICLKMHNFKTILKIQLLTFIYR